MLDSAVPAIRYRIFPKNPGAHLFEVTLTVKEPDPAGQRFTLPAWIPGSYLVRDYARNVVAISAESDGRLVNVEKTDKGSWVAEPTDSALSVTIEVYAYDLSVRGAHLDTTHAYFNGPCVFLKVCGSENKECEVEIVPPAGGIGADWRVATAMRRKKAGLYGYGAYTAEDYDELIDHPVEIGDLSIGEFEVDGTPHVLAIRGQTKSDMGRLCRDIARACESHIQLLGRPENLDRYVFLLAVLDHGYGGLEHGWSSSLICSRSDLPRRGDDSVSEDYRKFLGLCSHEYFHLWNVKRMKPAAFTPYRLESESYTGLLWVFEGITSYYDDLALRRSGLISEQSYLELVGQTITRVMRGSGRFKQSVEESSFDAWIKFYKQGDNASNAIVSYYAKGALIALALDLTLRHKTANRCSLDDVMSECWQRYGNSATGMPERGLETISSERSGEDLSDFFEHYVRGTADLPLQQLLPEFGVQYRTRRSQGRRDSGGRAGKEDRALPSWLGASLAPAKSGDVFRVVRSGSPAENAGLATGDVAVAMDNLKLTAGNLYDRLREHHSGDIVTIAVFRRDELMQFRVALSEPPEDACYLLIDDDASPAAAELRNSWMGSKQA